MADVVTVLMTTAFRSFRCALNQHEELRSKRVKSGLDGHQKNRDCFGNQERYRDPNDKPNVDRRIMERHHFLNREQDRKLN
ncbi:hypothetical protein EVAR_64729_1 [Eumeta japonica]|uniref:Uncharacterized protein n=1 Tax=Eumeta variegata TaxID=151549 RepID=A0A4C1ZVE3_EUMVA|nr:hypothetical protein EVAR_64729_1 [Eumeta japonica]